MHDARREHRRGLVYGLAAYGAWGVFPIYLKAVRAVPVLEVLCHRVVWALVVLAVVTAVRGEVGAIADTLRHRRALLVLSGSTVLIAINWLVYIFSVTYSRILESSLGYYINPLVSVLLGIVLLGERLTPLMKAAVVAAAAGVTWLAIDLGQLPWISLVLAFSFGLYGLLRKIAPVGALIGLTVETLLEQCRVRLARRQPQTCGEAVAEHHDSGPALRRRFGRCGRRLGRRAGVLAILRPGAARGRDRQHRDRDGQP